MDKTLNPTNMHRLHSITIIDMRVLIIIFIGVISILFQESCSENKNGTGNNQHMVSSPFQSRNRELIKSGFAMVFVEGGEFMMGGNDSVSDGGAPELRIADECPHLVSVEDFHIGKYEVTQMDWIEIMGETPYDLDTCLECPISLTSWYDIQEFIKKGQRQILREFPTSNRK